ncbi:response regulator transcription factor [soil metagenome]
MDPDQGHVLVVDDDPIVREVLQRYLLREGFQVTAACDGAEALDAVHESDPDLVLLDLMLPRIDGLEVFRRLRADSETERTAVIMLTAKGGETDRIVGLESGADDYVSKPFSPREVVARVRAVLRRTQPAEDADDSLDPIVFGRITIDPAAREVTIGGREAQLTPKEFELLYLFARNPRVAFSRVRLLDEIWDVAYDGDPSTVTVHIRRLRQKIEHDPSEPRHLVTVWGAGYRFEP